MEFRKAERQKELNQLWRRYLAVCKNKNHAINAMRKVTEKLQSADFTDADIRNLCDDLSLREDEKNGLNDLVFTQYNGEYEDI